MKGFVFLLAVLLYTLSAGAQNDTAQAGKKIITLSTVVIEKNMNVPAFIERIKNDSSFYKAFRNLHIISFSAVNDVRMLNKDGSLQAGLYSKTRQLRKDNCRTMSIEEEKVTGDFYDADGSYNYYTAQMYASLFFTRGIVCGEDNIVAGREFSAAGKSGMEKHKEQLKMLFFNPGKKINGLPFMSNKTAIYEDDMADKYDMSIDMEERNNHNCYVFRQKVKPGKGDGVVVDEMVTWFDEHTYEVVARNYSLSYDAAFYDFKVDMEVQMTTFDGLTIPSVIRYNGNWKAVTKKRERGIFTATLSGFHR
ncbi:MAG: hypothetical protein ABIT96_11530 [Ferruginibacter sp.]